MEEMNRLLKEEGIDGRFAPEDPFVIKLAAARKQGGNALNVDEWMTLENAVKQSIDWQTYVRIRNQIETNGDQIMELDANQLAEKAMMVNSAYGKD